MLPDVVTSSEPSPKSQVNDWIGAFVVPSPPPVTVAVNVQRRLVAVVPQLSAIVTLIGVDPWRHDHGRRDGCCFTVDVRGLTVAVYATRCRLTDLHRYVTVAVPPARLPRLCEEPSPKSIVAVRGISLPVGLVTVNTTVAVLLVRWPDGRTIAGSRCRGARDRQDRTRPHGDGDVAAGFRSCGGADDRLLRRCELR